MRQFPAMALGIGRNGPRQMRRGDISIRVTKRRDALRKLLIQEYATISGEIKSRKVRFEQAMKWTDGNAAMIVYMEFCRLEVYLEVSAYDLESLDSVFEWEDRSCPISGVNDLLCSGDISHFHQQIQAKLFSPTACPEDYREELDVDYECPDADLFQGESIIVAGLRDRANFLKGLTSVGAQEEDFASRG